MNDARTDLIAAVDLAIAGEWDKAHTACQTLEGDKTADWLHAILHKIEGDQDNSRYWYRRSGQSYEAWSDPNEELRAIKAVLTYWAPRIIQLSVRPQIRFIIRQR